MSGLTVRMMEAVSTSEISIKFCEAECYNTPEGCGLYFHFCSLYRWKHLDQRLCLKLLLKGRSKHKTHCNVAACCLCERWDWYGVLITHLCYRMKQSTARSCWGKGSWFFGGEDLHVLIFVETNTPLQRPKSRLPFLFSVFWNKKGIEEKTRIETCNS
jgi:hypothetical protein